jgi:undecaprenyl-diphosphatase
VTRQLARTADRADRREGERFVGRSATGLVLVILGALALAALLYAVSGVLVGIDHAVADGLNAVVSPRPAVVAALEVLAIPGASVTGWIVLSTLTVYLLVRRQHRLAAFVAVTGLGGAVLGPSVKEIVGRARPLVDDPVSTAPGPSFPSGHTLTVTIMIGVLLLVLLPTAPPRARRPLVVAGAVLVLVVAFTRLALGVHFLSDVVGGLVLGVCWIAVTLTAFRTWRRHEGQPVAPADGGLQPESAHDLVPAPDPEPVPLRKRTVAAELLVAAVLLFGVSVGSGLLVTRVLDGTGVEEADTDTTEWFVEQRTPTLDAVSGPAAELGDTTTIIAAGLVAAVLAVAVLRRWRPALLLTVLLVGELAIFLATTLVVDRARPAVPHLDTELPPTSSFPSGHTAASICLYGGIAALVFVTTRAWWRWLVVAVAVVLVVVVALARLYRGAHFPTDVLGSVLFAVPWLVATVTLLSPVRWGTRA